MNILRVIFTFWGLINIRHTYLCGPTYAGQPVRGPFLLFTEAPVTDSLEPGCYCSNRNAFSLSILLTLASTSVYPSFFKIPFILLLFFRSTGEIESASANIWLGETQIRYTFWKVYVYVLPP